MNKQKSIIIYIWILPAKFCNLLLRTFLTLCTFELYIHKCTYTKQEQVFNVPWSVFLTFFLLFKLPYVLVGTLYVGCPLRVWRSYKNKIAGRVGYLWHTKKNLLCNHNFGATTFLLAQWRSWWLVFIHSCPVNKPDKGPLSLMSKGVSLYHSKQKFNCFAVYSTPFSTFQIHYQNCK